MKEERIISIIYVSSVTLMIDCFILYGEHDFSIYAFNQERKHIETMYDVFTENKPAGSVLQELENLTRLNVTD